VTVAAFVLAMLAVTAVELLAGRSLAAMFGDHSAGTTTIGTVAGEHPRARTPEPTPTSGPTTVAPTTSEVPATEGATPSGVPSSPAAGTGPTGGAATRPPATRAPGGAGG
jgi:hypothetical protein